MDRLTIKFCWLCSRKLWGNHHAKLYDKDGKEYILHKSCAKEVLKLKEIYEGFEFARSLSN